MIVSSLLVVSGMTLGTCLIPLGLLLYLQNEGVELNQPLDILSLIFYDSLENKSRTERRKTWIGISFIRLKSIISLGCRKGWEGLLE